MEKDKKIKVKSILMRFLKGAVSGAITAMGLVQIVQPTNWSDFKSIISSLAMAGSYGAIVGLLLALNKWANWKEDYDRDNKETS